MEEFKKKKNTNFGKYDHSSVIKNGLTLTATRIQSFWFMNEEGRDVGTSKESLKGKSYDRRGKCNQVCSHAVVVVLYSLWVPLWSEVILTRE